jgi:hypothetical protein
VQVVSRRSASYADPLRSNTDCCTFNMFIVIVLFPSLFGKLFVKKNTIYTELKNFYNLYRSADKSLARHISRCILFDGENISFDASLVTYIYI